MIFCRIVKFYSYLINAYSPLLYYYKAKGVISDIFKRKNMCYNCTLAVPFLIYRLKIQRRFLDKKMEYCQQIAQKTSLTPTFKNLLIWPIKWARTILNQNTTRLDLIAKDFIKNKTRYDNEGYGADGFDEIGVDREGFNTLAPLGRNLANKKTPTGAN